MHDVAHKWTDAQILALERRVRRVYREAQKDVQAKIDTFLRRFQANAKVYRAKLLAGEITKEQYEAWIAGQVFQGKRWRAMLNDLTATLTHANEVAAAIVNDALPDTFAENANWMSYTIEHAGNADMGFNLYDKSTVSRLLRDVPTLLPVYHVDIPKDQRWNQKLITAQITQGILQGEALVDIAKRLRKVTDMNVNQSLTHARTAMTGAQNAGRMETFRRAGEMGIQVEREWIATLDGHTRVSHRALDGQTRPEGVPFVVTYAASKKNIVTDSIMYPGDPNAPGRMTYNCRCTLGSKLIGYPAQNARRRPNEQKLGDAEVQKPIRDMTYAEWGKWKGGKR